MCLTVHENTIGYYRSAAWFGDNGFTQCRCFNKCELSLDFTSITAQMAASFFEPPQPQRLWPGNRCSLVRVERSGLLRDQLQPAAGDGRPGHASADLIGLAGTIEKSARRLTRARANSGARTN
jgi:hypothetical protein